ncbi:cytochrome b/b6 domain-containing protein [Phyllobacterium sp. 0TCS1.6C]|uniref:cytochrome b/b6 domain-containing protein n=1 Tax=unclassified Phyllobacterium TaxID=2638441 RepID=UPI002263E42D|nr:MULTISPECIES: cytochrome b/b6 domain-containing protein [unclassified Phyllobacterium]MCX8280852.1 cytochrome b/b6 domain-containing protein [Phyllobacterium sp. 0TCS1.6C]MCX8295718.1 cytochrome b/b6 domain-containing protein [Phyllobacterium sp. 0TCS1.6A]
MTQVATSSDKPAWVKVYRHSLAVRITHWLNVLCLTFLLMSGLQIFNAHPYLYWGEYGSDALPDASFVAIEAYADGDSMKGVTRVGPIAMTTTGVLGASYSGGELTPRAFPAWLTIPSYQDLGTGRRWHFFFAWFFVINGLVYLVYGLVSRHFRRDLLPAAEELTPRHLGHEIAQHARLRFPRGEAARRYNSLQKLAYLGVGFVLLPLMVLTGLTMSPGFNAIFPWLLDLFGGRQSARTLHFIVAALTVGFVVIHLAMVLLSGVWNNLRSMITGYYTLHLEGGRRTGDEH